MPRTTVSMDSRTALCVKWLATQRHRSVSNLVTCLVWDAFKQETAHWSAEQTESLFDAFDSPRLDDPVRDA